MTITELHIQLDLQPENRISILEDVARKCKVARKCNEGYLFVDSLDGHCYLFNKDGNEADIKKLKKIDIEMFFNLNIKSIIIPDSVKSIGDNAFYKCKNLKSIIIPDSVKKIKNNVFENCINLKSIIIPDSVKSIGKCAFYYCKSLESIIIPDSVKSIKCWVFAFCKSLKSIDIPNSVKSIGDCAFTYCKNLKSIVIPDSVESIGNQTFCGCENLKSLIFKGKTIDQVKAMKNYPFGIENESIIRCV